MYLLCMSHVHAFSMHVYFFSHILIIVNYFGTFLIVSFSFPLLLVMLVVSMAPKRKSTLAQNPLHFEASFSSSNLVPLFFRFRNDDAHKAFSENFSRWGIHSECRVILGHFADTDLPIVIYSREWESLCDEPVTCPLVLIQEFYSNMHGIDRSVPHFVTRVWGISIPVTPQLVANVLRVPRIEFLNYPSCERLRTVSKDELMSTFCEHPSEWGERQFTYCSGFTKGPWFLNMVMTFVPYPLSH